MATVGETLAAERRRQGRSLADVAESTRIRERVLDRLEQGEYQALPSPTYVKGYIQNYARYLEIPAEPLLEQYRRESAGQDQFVSPADRYLSEIPAKTLVPPRDAQHAIPRNAWILMAVGLVVLILVLCGVSRLLTAPRTITPPPTSGAGAGTGTAASVSATETTASVATTSAAGSFDLTVRVRRGMASWVKITVDGKVADDGTLMSDDSRQYVVTKTAQLVIGQPSAVVVSRDGATVTVPAKPDARVTLTAKQ
jgi:cytoskeleton protein RodZ